MQEITPEIQQKLQTAKNELPQGYEIVESAALENILDQKNTLLSVFLKFQPLLAGFGGGGDLASMMPQLMGLIPQLQNDAELAALMEKVKGFVEAKQ